MPSMKSIWMMPYAIWERLSTLPGTPVRSIRTIFRHDDIVRCSRAVWKRKSQIRFRDVRNRTCFGSPAEIRHPARWCEPADGILLFPSRFAPGWRNPCLRKSANRQQAADGIDGRTQCIPRSNKTKRPSQSDFAKMHPIGDIFRNCTWFYTRKGVNCLHNIKFITERV